jgi:hypothetical protein
MTVIQTFAIGAAFAFAVSLVTVFALRPHLARLLEELCGSRARASFWLVVSGLCIFFLGLLAGTVSYGYENKPNLTEQELFFGLVTQVRAGLIGLLASLLAVAWVLLAFIRRFEEQLIPTFNLPPGPAGQSDAGTPNTGQPAGSAPWLDTQANPSEPTPSPATAPEVDPTRWRRGSAG